MTLQPIEDLSQLGPEFTNCVLCFEPSVLSFRVNGHAPNMLNGMGSVTYPKYLTNVPLRLTLAELADIRSRAEGLRIPLRNITPASNTKTERQIVKEKVFTFFNLIFISFFDFFFDCLIDFLVDYLRDFFCLFFSFFFVFYWSS